MFNLTTWKEGEKQAKDYMIKSGYKIITTNYSCVGVELDIIAVLSKRQNIKGLKRDFKKQFKQLKTKTEKCTLKQTFKQMKANALPLLIFTEVKARKTDKFGLGAEAISAKKKQHIIRGAEYYQTHSKFSGYQPRFDVASVDGDVVTYIENAFFVK